MSDQPIPHKQTPGSTSGEVDPDPLGLRVAERILGSSDDKGGISEIFDVALIFYAAAGTIIGSLSGALIYPLVHPLDLQRIPLWIFFLLCSVAVGGAVGFAFICVTCDVRSLIKWEKKYRPDSPPS